MFAQVPQRNWSLTDTRLEMSYTPGDVILCVFVLLVVVLLTGVLLLSVLDSACPRYAAEVRAVLRGMP